MNSVSYFCAKYEETRTVLVALVRRKFWIY